MEPTLELRFRRRVVTAGNWVVEDPRGRIVGWAQSGDREGLLELTVFTFR